MFQSYAGRRVLITGHTGFCGSWLSLWLSQIGAKVTGVAKEPETSPNLYDRLGIWSVNNSFILDISTPGGVQRIMEEVSPEFVFHLAAQPLVRRSYQETPETYRSNVIGTVEVLEAIRSVSSVRTAVMVTTDKVYENTENARPFSEGDRLGGKDPYSASKAACEIAIASYRDAVLDANRVLCASARGGNIIGGGDWSQDRLIPDIVRALTNRTTLRLRNPSATRPWQHVLALCHGYLLLGEKLASGDSAAASPWNFGPLDNAAVATKELVSMFSEHWREPSIEYEQSPFHEATFLALDSRRAVENLAWAPPWPVQQSVARTANWYRRFYDGEEAAQLMSDDIDAYVAALGEMQ